MWMNAKRALNVSENSAENFGNLKKIDHVNIMRNYDLYRFQMDHRKPGRMFLESFQGSEGDPTCLYALFVQWFTASPLRSRRVCIFSSWGDRIIRGRHIYSGLRLIKPRLIKPIAF